MLMKEIKTILLLASLMISLNCGKSYAHEAIVDRCYSETVDQFHARINRECEIITSEYKLIMDYFFARAGIDIHSQSRMYDIPEAVLFEFAHYIWNRISSYSDYLSKLRMAKCILEANVREYRKRFDRHQLDIGHMTDHHLVLADLRKKEKLLVEVKLFLDCLEHHKSYLAQQISYCQTFKKL
jgi:hypothetical protein